MINEQLLRIRDSLGAVIRGKSESIEILLVAVLSGGHVLLEDVPGVGKTTLAKALARSLSMEFSRIQFTPDLLPTDILGASVLNPREGTFIFHKGPIFSNLILADEINRASPRTQSALLEAMNEKQVTIDGVTRLLEEPFFVIATQNPVDYQGTYPLPEAQLDRFLVRLSMGYPDHDDELALVFDRRTFDPMAKLIPVLDVVELREFQSQVRKVEVSDEVGNYLLSIVRATRSHAELALGASPRAALGLFRASQARAFLSGRDWVSPADVQELAVHVLAHRLQPTVQARYGGKSTGSLVRHIIEETKVPR